MTNETFSVCQFFEDDSYEYVRRYVTLEEAVGAAKFFTNNVAASIGLTKRVIITDALDCIVFEWKFGEGIIFPPIESKSQQIELEPEDEKPLTITCFCQNPDVTEDGICRLCGNDV